MRLLMSAVLIVCVCGLTGARDEKPATAAEKMKALQKQFQDEQQGLIKEYEAAKAEKEKNEIVAKFRELSGKHAGRMLALAAENVKDPVAFDAAMMALQAGQGETAVKAAELIAEHFTDNPKLAPMLPRFGSMGPGGEKLLTAIAEKASDKKTKGTALYYLASGKAESADYPRTGAPLAADKQAAALKEAEGLLQKVAKEYGDIELPARGEKTQTVAKAVEGDLFFLNNLTIGKVLPDATVEDLSGKKVKISDYKGKVVVLDIWATWCGPCRAMIPHERELVEKLKDKPFALISLSADAKKETLEKFIEKEPMPWTHWWNGSASGAALETYKVRFYPTIYVLDEKGVIRFKHVRGEAMDKAVETLLKEVKTNG